MLIMLLIIMPLLIIMLLLLMLVDHAVDNATGHLLLDTYLATPPMHTDS